MRQRLRHRIRTREEKEMATIPNHSIGDLPSFEEVTGDPHQIAGLYFYLMLDCLVDLAYKVSCDFFDRPQLYTNLGDAELAGILARLHSRYGSDESLPNLDQRDRIYRPIFNQSVGHAAHNAENDESDFPHLRDDLISACAAFTERVFETGADMLKERVRTIQRPFHDYLAGIYGASVRWSKEHALPSLTEEISYRILRDKGVAAVFGIANPPLGEWPYIGDANGDKLVESISKQLIWDDQPGVYISREGFRNRQTAALTGSEAIAKII